MPANKTVIAAAWACILVVGCGRTPSPASPTQELVYGIISRAPSFEHINDPLPGIDHATVYHLGEVCVLWTDASGAITSKPDNSAQGVKSKVSLVTRDGRRVEFRYNSLDGKPGQMIVDTTTYELANGNLFLVSTASDPPTVKQLSGKLTGIKIERESLKAFGREDTDVSQFFATAATRE